MCRPNGAGKTTTIRMLEGFTPISGMAASSEGNSHSSAKEGSWHLPARVGLQYIAWSFLQPAGISVRLALPDHDWCTAQQELRLSADCTCGVDASLSLCRIMVRQPSFQL